MQKIEKLLNLLCQIKFIEALLKGVVAAAEHIPLLKSLNPINAIIDIGANKGQFALAARSVYPVAIIYSFEPLVKPAEKFNNFFNTDNRVTLFKSAIGQEKKHIKMHVSNRDDSSSLLPIGSNQSNVFPGTEESHTVDIEVAPLSKFLSKKDLVEPVFVKIDVQGFELEVLKGCSEFMNKFDYIYVECSFIELYEGQAFADEVITYLNNFAFKLKGIYNTFYDKKGIAVQADFLFSKGR